MPKIKLTPDAIRFIRSHSQLRGTTLAKLFAVHHSTISRLRRHVSWGAL